MMYKLLGSQMSLILFKFVRTELILNHKTMTMANFYLLNNVKEFFQPLSVTENEINANRL